VNLLRDFNNINYPLFSILFSAWYQKKVKNNAGKKLLKNSKKQYPKKYLILSINIVSYCN